MATEVDPIQHQNAVTRWRQAREARLRSSDGWLTLVDRVLLDPGDNRLPFGVLTLGDGVVKVQVQAGESVTRDGQPFSETLLRPEEGAPSATLAHGGRTYHVYRRGDVFAVRVQDPQAPALRAFAGLDYFPADPAWRIVARFERYRPPRTTVHQLDVGQSGPRQVPGLAHFTVGGRALTLEPVLEEDAQRLFFVFADLTTNRGTSPAGRFLYADLPVEHPDLAVDRPDVPVDHPDLPVDHPDLPVDHPDLPVEATVILDFNLAFNPPCAFTDFSTCPIPPPGNRLPVAVTAGEKDYHLAR